jgi:hypothetical protein
MHIPPRVSQDMSNVRRKRPSGGNVTEVFKASAPSSANSLHAAPTFIALAAGDKPMAATEMEDSWPLFLTGAAGVAECQARLTADGFLLLRSALPRDVVLAARAFLLRALAADGFIAPLPANFDDRDTFSSDNYHKRPRRRMCKIGATSVVATSASDVCVGPFDWAAATAAVALDPRVSPGVRRSNLSPRVICMFACTIYASRCMKENLSLSLSIVYV